LNINDAAKQLSSTVLPLEETKSNLNSNISPCTLSFHNIEYSLKNEKWRKFCFKTKPDSKILNRISGSFTSGMNAIMGKQKKENNIQKKNFIC